MTARAEGQTGLSRWLTLVCLGLVLLCGTVQAEHLHPADGGSADTHAACSLCATAHVGVCAAVAPLLHHLAMVFRQAEPPPALKAFVAATYCNLYTRPPPSGLNVA